MNAPRKLSLVAGAAAVALSLLAAPALASDAASDAPAVLAVEGAPAEGTPADDDGDHRISLADTPRDRFGLILLAALFTGGGIAFINGRKQLKGERDKASGEFRWR